METGTGDAHAPLVQESNRPNTLHPEIDQQQTGAITNGNNHFIPLLTWFIISVN